MLRKPARAKGSLRFRLRPSSDTAGRTWNVIGEIMKPWIHTGAVVFSIALVACNGDKPKELFETAELEERQHNVAHAKQLYEDLVRLYPSSPQAETARARLALLNKAP
jgi:hypothetical protein